MWKSKSTHCAEQLQKSLHNNMTTIIYKHVRTPIFLSVLSKKDFIKFFEMEELGASEAHKTEILDYEVIKI